jgi:DNA-binding transcriptional ArsR family regulator
MDWDDYEYRVRSEIALQHAVDALRHPVRRFVVGMLQVGGTNAGDLHGSIQASFGISIPRASHHLNVLAKANIVSVSPDGPWRFYDVRPGSAAALAEWLDDTGLSANATDR